jgi:hypothetical protein
MIVHRSIAGVRKGRLIRCDFREGFPCLDMLLFLDALFCFALLTGIASRPLFLHVGIPVLDKACHEAWRNDSRKKSYNCIVTKVRNAKLCIMPAASNSAVGVLPATSIASPARPCHRQHRHGQAQCTKSSRATPASRSPKIRLSQCAGEK